MSAESDYLEQKAKSLGTIGWEDTGHEAGTPWTTDQVNEAFGVAGMTPYEHYQTHGADEGLIWGSTVTTPDFSANQSQMNAQIPDYFDSLMSSIPNYNSAYADLAALPGQIDDWTAESLKRQRVTGDQATNVFNKVANQRAGTGIQGGTETQALEANAQAALSQIILENQNNIQNQANQLKAGTIQNLPNVALMPVNSGISLYGTTSGEAANWGNIAMQTLLNSY